MAWLLVLWVCWPASASPPGAYGGSCERYATVHVRDWPRLRCGPRNHPMPRRRPSAAILFAHPYTAATTVFIAQDLFRSLHCDQWNSTTADSVEMDLFEQQTPQSTIPCRTAKAHLRRELRHRTDHSKYWSHRTITIRDYQERTIVSFHVHPSTTSTWMSRKSMCQCMTSPR